MNKTILIINNNPGVSKLLANEGYHVLDAANGQEALAMIRTQPLDLIVLDLVRLDLDGFQFLRTLRLGSQVPVIVTTYSDNISDRVVCLESGADDYIVKPFAIAEFLVRVRVQLRRAGVQGDPTQNGARQPSRSWYKPT